VKSSPQSFKEYQVQQWSKEEGYNELVIIHEIFTAEEYEKVWNAVGGHGGEIFDLHCDLRRGMTLEEAIDAKNRATENMLISIIEGPEGRDCYKMLKKEVDPEDALRSAKIERRNFLRELKNSNYVAYNKDNYINYDLTIDYLFKSNILWVVEALLPQYTRRWKTRSIHIFKSNLFLFCVRQSKYRNFIFGNNKK
jgi:hypothetical protein